MSPGKVRLEAIAIELRTNRPRIKNSGRWRGPMRMRVVVRKDG